jgi:hypothetical protein
MHRARKGARHHVYCWVRRLLSEGVQPLMEVVEESDSHEELAKTERFYIAYFRSDGVFASQAIDSSGEILDIDGCDISTLSKDGVANYEHKEGDKKTEGGGNNGEEIVGRIIYAKKIFSVSDCDTDREERYWDEVKVPFIYGMVRLYDGAGHSGAPRSRPRSATTTPTASRCWCASASRARRWSATRTSPTACPQRRPPRRYDAEAVQPHLRLGPHLRPQGARRLRQAARDRPPRLRLIARPVEKAERWSTRSTPSSAASTSWSRTPSSTKTRWRSSSSSPRRRC